MANHEWLLSVFEDIERYAQRYNLISVMDAVETARKVAKSEITDLEAERDCKIISILRASQVTMLGLGPIDLD